MLFACQQNNQEFSLVYTNNAELQIEGNQAHKGFLKVKDQTIVKTKGEYQIADKENEERRLKGQSLRNIYILLRGHEEILKIEDHEWRGEHHNENENILKARI